MSLGLEIHREDIGDNTEMEEDVLVERFGIPTSCDVSMDVGNSGLQSITVKMILQNYQKKIK